jgi:Ca2+-binding RTX toxin-like protein
MGNDYVDGGKGHDKIYASSGNDSVLGGDGHDTVFGGDGNDTIDGGKDHDRLFGGTGNDNITGGEGQDTFFFGGAHGDDVVTDFNLEEDTLYLGKTVSDFITFDDVKASASVATVNTVDGVMIDTGGGTVFLQGLTLDDLDLMLITI